MIRAKIQWYTPIHVQSSRLSLWFSGDVDIRWRSFQKRCRESIVFKYITRIQEIFTWTEKTRFPRILVIGFTKLPKEFSVFPKVHGRFPQKRNYKNLQKLQKNYKTSKHQKLQKNYKTSFVGIKCRRTMKNSSLLHAYFSSFLLFRTTGWGTTRVEGTPGK